MPVRRRTFRYNHVYILAVGAGAPTLQFRRSGFVHYFTSCRRKTRANAVRSGDGKHKIFGTNTQCKFQPMQCPSVERTSCNRLYVYGRGRRRCGDPTSNAVRFLLVGNAHRAFRGEKHGLVLFGLSTEIIKLTNCICIV